MGSPYSNPHTIFLHYSPLEVANLHGTEITLSQYKSRSMLKAFTVAAANARAKYGVIYSIIFWQLRDCKQLLAETKKPHF